MDTNDLQDRFPDMVAVAKAPVLGSVNGFGLLMYGRRDYDQDTGTFIKTWCLCALFVPLFSFRSYRVADAEGGGWYFLGREPVSVLGKAWNMLVVCAVIGGLSFGAWTNHVNSPAYIAAQRVAEADRLVEVGQLAEAARMYSDVSYGKMPHAMDAREKLQALIETGIDDASAKEAAGVIQATVDRYGADEVGSAVPGIRQRVLTLVSKHRGSDPRGALELLDSLPQAKETNDSTQALREALLLRITELHPDDLEALSKLALIYEARGESQACIDLLGPHEKNLGDTEGARILGQIYAGSGQVESAYTLLKPYTMDRLDRLHEAERDYDNRLDRAWDQQIELLNQGAADEGFYTLYEQVDETKQNAMVNAYVLEAIKGNRSINKARDRLLEESAVVPVALDLGIVMLGRAATMTDAQAKRAELESAEQVFLAIRGLAGETDEYKIYLGKIYYWLGKSDQGRELLDQLLATHERSFDVLFAVTQTLREVGAVSEARGLIEEAYRHSKEPTEKYTAARMRSVMSLGMEDQIKWLELTNPEEVEPQAALNSALGERAASHGKTDEAKRYLRLAIDGYESLPESVGMLNNTALAYLTLFELDGDADTFARVVVLMDKAVALMPDDSILLMNTAQVHLQAAINEALGGRIDIASLRARPSLEMLLYLCDNHTQWDTLTRRVGSHPSTVKAFAYGERLMLIAPQRNASYSISMLVHGYARDTDRLKELYDRVVKIDLDLDDDIKERLAIYAGERDSQHQKDYAGKIEKWRGVVEALRGPDDPVTFSVAVGLLIDAELSGGQVGLTVDSDDLVTLAEEAFDASVSNGSRRSLSDALCYRAVQSLSREDSAFAVFATAARRSLDATDIIALGLRPSESFSSLVAEHPDVQRVIAQLETRGERYPDRWTPWSWAMLQSSHPQLAAEVASLIRANEEDRITRQLTRSLSGLSASGTVEILIESEIEGDGSDSKAIIDNAINNGIPLPSIAR